MWEAYGLENEDFLWAGVAFRGGIAGQQQATCGALSTAAMSLGLRHRCSPGSQEKSEAARAAACDDAAGLIQSFKKEFGGVTCIDLLKVDLSAEGAREKARSEGLFKRVCYPQLRFIIRKLYEIDRQNRTKS